MITVPTYLSASAIHGIGVFAAEPIPSGSVIFAEEPWFTIRMPAGVVAGMNPLQRDFVRTFAYLRDGMYRLSADNDRFLNHSDDPNTEESDDNLYTFARRDIESGEEITVRYSDFCDNDW